MPKIFERFDDVYGSELSIGDALMYIGALYQAGMNNRSLNAVVANPALAKAMVRGYVEDCFEKAPRYEVMMKYHDRKLNGNTGIYYGVHHLIIENQKLFKNISLKDDEKRVVVIVDTELPLTLSTWIEYGQKFGLVPANYHEMLSLYEEVVQDHIEVRSKGTPEHILGIGTLMSCHPELDRFAPMLTSQKRLEVFDVSSTEPIHLLPYTALAFVQKTNTII